MASVSLVNIVLNTRSSRGAKDMGQTL